MKVIGIDPGLKGSIAILADEGVLVELLPSIGNKLNIRWLAEYLAAHKDGANIVYIEEPNPMPGQGVKSLKTSLINWGNLEATVALSGIPYQLVRANTWTKEMHKGMPSDLHPKDKSMLVAMRLFPQLDFKATPRCKVPHDGMIDAVLIAAYGRKQLGVKQ